MKPSGSYLHKKCQLMLLPHGAAWPKPWSLSAHSKLPRPASALPSRPGTTALPLVIHRVAARAGEGGSESPTDGDREAFEAKPNTGTARTVCRETARGCQRGLGTAVRCQSHGVSGIGTFKGTSVAPETARPDKLLKGEGT